MMVDRRNIIFLSVATLSLMVIGANAGESHEHEHHAQEAHVHGAWELFAALDDNKLSVTLKGPLIDFVGFERPPATENERSAIQDLQDRLGAPEMMLTLDARAKCTLLEPAQIILPEGFLQGRTAGGEEHGLQPGKANDHHKHNARERKDHQDHHDVHTNDLEVTYAFDCQSPGRLRAITMTGFDAFPAIESVDAVFLGDTKQAADRLGRATPTLMID